MQDYANIEAIIAHEYFHNWTGNRITCRDWFQLCLKEGLHGLPRPGVFRRHALARGQAHPGRAALRRTSSRRTRVRCAHPVRPESYKEINNFYTATVYEKGAEVVRMMKTLLGFGHHRKAGAVDQPRVLRTGHADHRPAG
jgi:aminopeptidase N